MKGKAVISFYNTVSGKFSWWDQFPLLISRKLAAEDIDHIAFYKDYTADSAQPSDQRCVATNENLSDWKWIRSNVLPLCREYQQVILHSHSHYAPLKLWPLTYLHPRCEWHLTEHRIASSRISAAKRLAKAALRKLRVLPHSVIGVSQAVTRRNALLFGQQDLRTIYNGIDLEQYDQTVATPAPARPRFLFVGRMEHGKGVYVLVEAFRLLKERGIFAQLTLVGAGTALKELEGLSRKYGLEDRLRFTGYQYSVQPFYRQHEVVIIPSLVEEALSLVALEARAMGLPVIYANKGGLPEVMASGSGLLLERTDPEHLAEAVARLVEDSALYGQLAERCKVNMGAFSLETMGAGYVEHYLATFTRMSGTVTAGARPRTS